MNRRFHNLVRDLHLYLGLFIAPFILLFSVSVIFLVHAWLPGANREAGPPRTVTGLSLPSGLASLGGRARVDALQGVLAGIGVHGEIGFVRHNVKKGVLSMPVAVPGRETEVEIDIAARTAVITQREKGVWDGLVLLHKSPGPHLADIRMNWLPMRVWGWLADGTVYLVFFLTLSGVYLWAVLRSERRIGLILLATGVLSFAGVVNALVH